MADARTIDVYGVSERALKGALAFARATPVLLLDTLILAVVVGTARRLLLGDAAHSPYLTASVEAVANVLVFAPLTLAAHRFALEGVATPKLGEAWRAATFAAFLKASLVVSALSLGLYFGGALVAEALPEPFATTAFLAAFTASIALTVRLTLLFPAIAVGAPGAGFARALADSAGRGWPIFLALVTCSAPFLVFGLMLEGAAREVAPMRPAGLILAALRAAIDVAWTIVLAHAAAGMFRILADRLARAPAEAPR